MAHRPARGPLPDELFLSGLGLVLLVVATVGVAITGGFRAEAGSSGPSATLPVPADGPPSSVRPPGEGQPTVPSVPGDTPGLPASATVLAFDTAGPLAESDALGAWTVPSGDWETQGGHAAVVRSDGPRSLAVVTPSTAPAFLQVALPVPVDNAGLVFRYLDPQHFLAFVAVPSQDAAWLIQVDGDSTRPTLLASVADVPFAAGTVLGVRFVGGRIDLAVNGSVQQGVADPGPATLGAFGFAAAGAGSEPTARFDDLTYASG